MTTIIGIQGDNYSLVCVDSRVSDVNEAGYATQIATLGTTSSKVAVNGKYILGAAGDVRAINILHHAFTPPSPPANLKGKKLDHFVTAKFIPALRECFEQHGYAAPPKETSEHVAEHGSTIFMSVNGMIYIIDGDYSWMSDINGVYAIGTGAQYALGALQATIPARIGTIPWNTAKTLAIKALSIAAKFDPYTGAPYHTLTQGIEKKPK
jgi:ATP-dependent protease HslVU (ClpYQ) peptidase subunit